MSTNEFDETTTDDEPDIENEEFVQCPACLRRMRSSVFAKHPTVCRENPENKRKVKIFDMTKYRAIKAGDVVIPVQKITSADAGANSNNVNLRPSQTRSAKRDRRSDAFVPPVISKFCCPQCKRTFCEKAYDRHVAFCSSKMKKLQQPPSEETLMARLKLDRRVKFSANRTATALCSSPMTTKLSNQPATSTPPLNKEQIKPIPSIPRDTIRLLSMKKPLLDSLARCPWCSKPYMPNCIHYCRNSKELFSIHSK